MTELLLISYLVVALIAVLLGYVWRVRANQWYEKAESYRKIIEDLRKEND